MKTIEMRKLTLKGKIEYGMVVDGFLEKLTPWSEVFVVGAVGVSNYEIDSSKELWNWDKNILTKILTFILLFQSHDPLFNSHLYSSTSPTLHPG